jgi:energy-coupling factor transport system permease protein
VREDGSFHALAWAWWALAALVTVHLAPNPVYVALVVAVALLVAEAHRREGPLGRMFPVLVGIAAVFVVVRVVLSAVTTSTGQADVLFTLPAATLPQVLGGFTVGGSVHASVVLAAAIEGFVIVGVIAAFAAFNAVVVHEELVRSLPRAFHELGLVVTVALAFVPATITAIQTVREADIARTGGRAVRRGRLLRTAVPVLESGMERAMRLAESMDARGFAHGGAGPAEKRAGWLALGGVGALAAAFAALVGAAPGVAAGLGLVGLVAIAGAVSVASRANPRPRHRPTHIGRDDVVLIVVVSLAPVGLAVLAMLGEPTLRWLPSEEPLPGFRPIVALAVLVLAAPALRLRQPVRVPTVRVQQETNQ